MHLIKHVGSAGAGNHLSSLTEPSPMNFSKLEVER